MQNNYIDQIECPIHYIRWVQTAMMIAFEFTNEQLGLAALRQKRDYDRNWKPRKFARNDYPPLVNLKLGMGFVGPYLVVKRVSHLNYIIQKSRESEPFPAHVDVPSQS